MVSRTRAFTIATAWIVAGLAAGTLALGELAGGDPRATVSQNLPWIGVLAAAGLTVAGLWVAAGARHAWSSAMLGGQAALFGLAAALMTMLLLILLAPAAGGSSG